MTLQGQRCPHATAEAQSTAGHLTTLPWAPRLTRGHALHFSARNRVLDRNEAFPLDLLAPRWPSGHLQTSAGVSVDVQTPTHS